MSEEQTRSPLILEAHSPPLETILETRKISKSFGPVQAVRDVDWSVKRGEVCALLGDNGAGKSTLIKLICGAILPSSGEVWVRGARAQITGPSDALALAMQDQGRLQFQGLLFSKIVPNCKKLGLLDAGDGWLRERFTEIGVIQFEDWVDTGEEYEALDEVAKDRASA